MSESVYIHIPFCKSKCKYCSFVSTTHLEIISNYVQALIKEIKYSYKSEPLKTIYFGGGTPSLLNTDLIKKILKTLNYTSDTEITFEINPDDANINFIKNLYDLGINRLSFGSQTFDENILHLIGRRHRSIDILNSVVNSLKAGFENISLDLIYGLPTQTMYSLEKDLNIIKDLNIKHISTYGLKIEEPSFYYYNNPQNLPDDDMQAEMYIKVNEILNSAGFKRYEISNFAIKGFESKHNLNYWNNKEYYGFGAAAHGYINSIRYSNTENIEEYIQNPLKHKTEHIVSLKEQIEEEIFLGFRKEYGINIKDFKKKYNLDFETKFKNTLNKYIPNYINKTDYGYKLTLDGVLLSNNILADFID